MSESDSYDDMEWNDLVSLASERGLFHTGMDREEVTAALRDATAGETRAAAPDETSPDAASGEGEGNTPGPAADKGPGEPSDEELEAEEDGDPFAAVPVYQSHKRVRGVYIHRVEGRRNGAALIIPMTTAHYLAGHPNPDEIEPEDIPQILKLQDQIQPFNAQVGWIDRFKGTNKTDPGVWVLYDDGYESWSPTEAFDNGYHLLP